VTSVQTDPSGLGSIQMRGLLPLRQKRLATTTTREKI
jgi:hypothetical protein